MKRECRGAAVRDAARLGDGLSSATLACEIGTTLASCSERGLDRPRITVNGEVGHRSPPEAFGDLAKRAHASKPLSLRQWIPPAARHYIS
jgi:hypothetical protein